jgi:hypothetical protein
MIQCQIIVKSVFNNDFRPKTIVKYLFNNDSGTESLLKVNLKK